MQQKSRLAKGRGDGGDEALVDGEAGRSTSDGLARGHRGVGEAWQGAHADAVVEREHQHRAVPRHQATQPEGHLWASHWRAVYPCWGGLRRRALGHSPVRGALSSVLGYFCFRRWMWPRTVSNSGGPFGGMG